LTQPLLLAPEPASGGTIDDAEIARFSKLAETWWDETGPFRPLHWINPVRLAYLREQLIQQFGRDASAMRPFEGLRLLDIGCGGGLISEPMARMGFSVTGIDAAAKHIPVAATHAAAQGLSIDYRHAAAEDLLAAGETFDVVFGLEIVEHVAQPDLFVASVGTLVRPGGVAVFSTLNRTLRSLAFGVIAAEYVLRWLPRGTHSWDKFLKPSELAAHIRAAGLTVQSMAGLSFDPLHWRWSVSRDLGVNYFIVTRKPG